MRSSRSGSARGLRSGGAAPEQSTPPTSTRSRAGGGSSQTKAKRRGRGLPLSKNRTDSDNEVEPDEPPKIEQDEPPKNNQKATDEENGDSQKPEETEAIQDPPIETQEPEEEEPEPQEIAHQEFDDRLQALQDGKPLTVTATVLGAIIDRNYDVTKGVGQDGNQFFCEICQGFGNVVCCDGCPKVYHAACIDPEDPARKGLDNDDEPWFCGSCRDRGNSETLSPSRKERFPRPDPGASIASASMPPDKAMSRPERRAGKRKCNECQQAGGEMTPCEGCGVNYIHIPPCREDDDSTDGMSQMCSNCRVEAVVEQEEEAAELEDDANSNSQPPRQSSEDTEVRRLRKNSVATDKDDEEDTSEEAEEEEEEEEEQEEEEEELEEEEEEEQQEEEEEQEEEDGDADNEESPSKKKRKRAYSEASETKKKKKVSADGKKKKKKGDKKKKKKRKKRRIQVDDGEAETPSKGESTPRRSPTSRGLVEPTPAFFFFLNDSKLKIERVLARKHRYFNRLPKGLERNELIAREGAHWWVKLRQNDQKRYFTMSMRDFEEKVIEWKEEKTIREMIAARDPEDRYLDGNFDHDDDSQDLTPEDELMMFSKHQRLFLSTSVGSKPFTPEAGKSNNRILLELLQDMRFHPMSMFNPLRTDGESGLMDRSKISIPHFEVQGPIATSTGDECSGCTRGWNHFCPVLKRRIPAVENRARLQPPMSSLMATRIGLGLKPKISEMQEDQGKDAELFEPRLTYQAQEAKRVPAIPSFTLTNPIHRADDVVCFVEECLAMKVPEPSRPSPPDSRGEPKKKSVLSRGALPMRGRRKSNEYFEGTPSTEVSDNSKVVLNKCGRCRTIIDNDTGCIQCRRAQLVINTSKRLGPSGQLSLTGREKKNKDAVRVQTTMIGRLTVKETNFEDQAESDRAVANSIIKLRWMPSAVLPPQQTYVPTPKPNKVVRDYGEESDGADGEIMADEGDETLPDLGVNGVTPEQSDELEDSKLPAKETNGDAETGSRPSRLRPRRALATLAAAAVEAAEAVGEEMEIERTIDRQRLAKRHKEEATELAKRCLNGACCGIFLAMVRRDPLCLFAEPVPSNVVGYSQVVTNPIDVSKIKSRIMREKYTSLSAFVADCRLLCTNALAFNPPGSIYSKTAKELHDVLDVMQKRAIKWVSAIKDAHASSFAWRSADALYEDDDPFQDLRKIWPEAVDMLENGDWLREQVASDFMRTKENESAYYGSIAVRRAAAAAEASLATYTDTGGIHSTVIRRSHTEDESLRRVINAKVAQLTGPVQLKDVPRWRAESILRTLRRVQSRRVEGRIMSENGCARCDGIRTEAKLALNAVRWGRNKRKGELETLPRVDESRLSLTTGLASKISQERIGREFDGSEVVKMPDKHDDEEEDESEDEVPATTAIQVKMVLEPVEAAEAVDQWDKKLDVAVMVKGSSVHGWGLFADQPFKKGDVVAEYIGEYICNAVADSREKMYQERRIQDYQFRVDENLVIDATLKGGHGRYINHNCNPNCIANIVDGQPPNKHLKRVMIIAQRDIKAREEVTYDYQFPLELDLEARIPCNCGSLLCRGFMNWDLPEKGSKNRVLRTQKRGGNMRDRIRRLGRPLKKQDEK